MNVSLTERESLNTLFLLLLTRRVGLCRGRRRLVILPLLRLCRRSLVPLALLLLLGPLLLLDLVVLPLDERDQRVAAPLQLHGRPGLDEPVESELGGVTNGRPQLLVDVLLVEAQLVEHADQEAVLLLGVVLALVRAVGDAKLVEWSAVSTAKHSMQRSSSLSYKIQILPGNFGIKSLPDQSPPLDFGLSLFNLVHDSVNILKFLAPVPEDGAVFLDLLGGLAVNLLGDGIDLVAPILFMQADKLVKVTFRPGSETLKYKIFLVLDNYFAKIDFTS